jgi:hypothetical protein
MERAYQIAAYYFPNYHYEPRNKDTLGEGWTEWDQVRVARPRFPGHAQPKVPLWGYEDESDPAVMARKIDAAADHAITTFLFDWYWDVDGPSLHRALEQGFMRAPNNDRLTFGLMWANHWAVSRATFDAATAYVIDRYLAHPAYWTIDGRPYFSIYELMTLVRGLGGIEQTANALEAFRGRVSETLGCDLHLNAVLYGVRDQAGAPQLDEQRELLQRCRFDSLTSYVWQHHQPLPDFPATSYGKIAAEALGTWDAFAREYPLPYHPNVTAGWDPSPRTDQARPFEEGPYPATAVLVDNTPAAFERALRAARAFLDGERALQPIVTLYAWNEWAEGGYLEPDIVHRMGYLEAVKRVFGAPPA